MTAAKMVGILSGDKLETLAAEVLCKMDFNSIECRGCNGTGEENIEKNKHPNASVRFRVCRTCLGDGVQWVREGE